VVDFPKNGCRKLFETRPQKAPLRIRQPGHFGKLPATTVAPLPAEPVGTALPDRCNAHVNIGMKLEKSGHIFAQIILKKEPRRTTQSLRGMPAILISTRNE
jgi:hypothetical protein